MWWRRSSIERHDTGSESVCRVCGWDGEEFYDEIGSPTYAICDCCGAESGVNEYKPKVAAQYRQQWIARGSAWLDSKAKPMHWDLDAQLQKLPDHFR